MQKTILHVDMDAFYASVEQHDHPEYAGKPVVVGAARDRRGVVAAASYEARKFGIHSAMPSREAASRCPHAIFLPANMARYKEVSTEIFAIFDRFTPHREALSVDEAFLDVTGSMRLFGTGYDIAVQIKKQVNEETGLTASVGVAPNKSLAKIASDLEKPDGLTLVPFDPDEIREFLAPLEIKRLWGVGKVTQEKLQRKGLFTIGQIQNVTITELAALLGQRSAEHIAALAIGEDAREVAPRQEQKSYSREHTFGEDCEDSETLTRILCVLVEDVGAQIRQAGVFGKTAHLKLRWKGFETITRQKQLSFPCNDDASLRDIAKQLLSAEEVTRPVRLIGFGISNTVVKRPDEQADLFDTQDDDRKKRETISRAMDDIRRQFGKNSIRGGGTMPSDER